MGLNPPWVRIPPLPPSSTDVSSSVSDEYVGKIFLFFRLDHLSPPTASCVSGRRESPHLVLLTVVQGLPRSVHRILAASLPRHPKLFTAINIFPLP